MSLAATATSLTSWLTLLQALPADSQHKITAQVERQGIDAVLGYGADAWTAAGLDTSTSQRIETPDLRRIAGFTDWLAADARRQLVPVTDACYPKSLEVLPQRPLALWVEGNAASLSDPQLAIVGSRSGTQAGLNNARQFAQYMARSGLGITSGLALGIDSAAHEGALAAGGTTLAVLGVGLDRVYPRENLALAQRIVAEGGALASEYPPGVGPDRHRFPARNRLIAGLSVGTLVVEAAQRSGALITARLAAELGREVFAIPGSIHNPLAKGCHRLIRDGAKLVDDAADILSELAPMLAGYLTESSNGTEAPAAAERKESGGYSADPQYAKLLKVLGHDPVGIDALTEYTGLTSAELSSMLLILELEGLVEVLPGQRISRIS